MIEGLTHAVQRLARRMLLVVARGNISTSVDDTQNVQFAQFVPSPYEVIDGMPRVVEFGFNSRPPVGSDAIAVFLGGDRANGVIIATNNQSFRFKLANDGESVLFDAFGKSVYLSKTAITIECNGAPVNVNHCELLTVNGPSQFNGDMNIAGNVYATKDVVAQHGTDNSVSLTNHLTQNVESGSDDSGTPKPGT